MWDKRGFPDSSARTRDHSKWMSRLKFHAQLPKKINGAAFPNSQRQNHEPCGHGFCSLDMVLPAGHRLPVASVVFVRLVNGKAQREISNLFVLA